MTADIGTLALIFQSRAKHLEDLQTQHLKEDLHATKTDLSKIRTLSAVLTLDFSAEWKTGKLPSWNKMAPDTLIEIGTGHKYIGAEFILTDGQHINTDFHNAEDFSLMTLPTGDFRLRYISNAAPGSEIFGVTPGQIIRLQNLQFDVIYLGTTHTKENTKVQLYTLTVEFFVNGKSSFSVNEDLNEAIQPQKPNGMTLLRSGFIAIHTPPISATPLSQ